MDRKALQEEEQRRLEAAFLGFRDGGLEPFLLYPELRLTEPVGLWDNFAPASCFFPFYNTLILPLEPFTNPKFFANYYGLTLDDVVKLTREEKIAPVLTTAYTNYPRYFDPLFQEAFVPNMHRLEIGMSYIRFGSTKVYVDSDQIVRRRIGTHEIDDSIFRSFHWLKGFGIETRENLLNLMGQYTARMRIMGYDDILQALENIPDHNAYLDWLGVTGSVLTRPALFSLNGWTNFDSALLKVGRAVLSKFAVRNHTAKVVETTSSLITALSVRLRYGHPANYPPLEFAAKIRDISEVEENHRILRDLKRYIERGELDRALDKASQAKEVMKMLDREIVRLARRYQIIRYTVHPALALISGAGIAGVQSLLTGQPVGSTPSSIYFPLATTFGVAALDMTVEKIKERLNTVSELLARSLVRAGIAPVLLWKRERRS